MLDRTDSNARAIIGGNLPPTSAIELAEPTIEALNQFLRDLPVITNDAEAREAKALLDRTAAALKGIEDERWSKVEPLNAQVREINARYHKWHNSGSKPGIWDNLLKELRIRLTAFARAEEAKRQAAAEAARRAAAEAERKAREAEAREREAAADAAQGVCDVDIAAATQEADQAFQDFRRADRQAQRAERDTKVRIGGGFRKISSLRDKEILTVTDWRSAIAEMSGDNGKIPQGIADAILTAARVYRRMFEALPSGITATHERSL
jgi:hypothetical protein